MSKPFRSNRKVSDEDIIRLNSVGLSLATIARQLGCHTSTVTQRLWALNIPPADTRRAFMEEIYLSMPAEQRAWLESQLGASISVKDYIRNILAKEFVAQRKGAFHAAA